MRSYRRRLPHIDAPGLPVFLTWRLHGSLPPERRFEREYLTSGEAFVAWDRWLEQLIPGPATAAGRDRHLGGGGVVQIRRRRTCEIDARDHAKSRPSACTLTAPIGDRIKRGKRIYGRYGQPHIGTARRKIWQQEYSIASYVTPVSATASVGTEWNPLKPGWPLNLHNSMIQLLAGLKPGAG